MDYDLIIIGGGPAGMTAGIYSARQKLKTLVITKEFGGQMGHKAVDIENYPGFEKISGFELIAKFEDQLKHKGIEVLSDEVSELKKENGFFSVLTKEGKTIQSKTVIIATGSEPRRLEVKGEEEFLGRGVSYCTTCDGPLFNNKDVAIIGGGEAGFEAALFLNNYANKIYILEYGDVVKCGKENQDKASLITKIKVITSSELQEIKGEDFVNQIVFKDRKTGEEKVLNVQGVFVQAGYQPATSFLKDLVELNEKKEIVVNFETFETKTSGLFAVGDVTSQKVKQIVVACGQGAVAVINAYKYINI
ncbi:MAG TPA: FAD-dependent oxidoreductase [Candidatus Pacearchaeota archaeon]|nr:FAD-dependent oxidoreductase [Candidatus Pacearchaeota archaeon]HPR79608.1 FAD-dependent oxidoreductase [Candidatus Pacearchaeota archaeon]